MGQTLSEPVKDKHSSQERDAKSAYGASSMQGWRISMEDAHTTILKLPNRAPAPPSFAPPPDSRYDGAPPVRRDMYSKTPPTEVRPPPGSDASSASRLTAAKAVPSDTITTATVEAESAMANSAPLFDSKLHISFYAVYDGHGGQSVAQYAGKRLHWKVAQTEEFTRGDYEAALKRGFLALDEELRDDPDFQNDPSGCTAVVAVVTDDDTIFVANSGDSRCILSSDGKAIAMSEDHKPGNPDESARIMRGGGFVEYGRVNGNLALSRALGDFEFKQNPTLPAEEQVVTAFPDVVTRKTEPSDEFLVLACDGIWDVLDNQQVADFVSKGVADGSSLDKVCEDLMDRCLAPDRRASELGGIGCDNMTVVVVALLRGKSFEDWAAGIKARWTKYVAELGHDPTIPPPPQFSPADEHSDSDDDQGGPGNPMAGLGGIGGFSVNENGEFVLNTQHGQVVFRTVGGAGDMEVDPQDPGAYGMQGAQSDGQGRFEEIEERPGGVGQASGENAAYKRGGGD